MGTVKAQDAVEFRIVITGHETKWKMGVEYGIMAYLRIYNVCLIHCERADVTTGLLETYFT